MLENTPEELAQFAEEKRTQGRRDFFSDLFYNIHAYNKRVKNIDIMKYQTTVLKSTEISSVSGGSCWNEDHHYDDTVRESEIQKQLKNQFNHVFAPLMEELSINQENLDAWLAQELKNKCSYNSIKEVVDYEYYGNSTTYGIYGVEVEKVVEHFCDQETKEIYQNELKKFQDTSNEKKNEKIKYKSKSKYKY